MPETVRTLSSMRKGQKGVIDSFTDYELSLKLLEMGCIPGELIEVIRIAPLGDPIAISISGYMLGLRKAEASTVRVRIQE
ncbi:MAG: ferrous iron transport protein A [Bacteroidetes bacterium]|nr:MAG: ferrous iron transport protein A [Bacteroidota bacterium]